MGAGAFHSFFLRVSMITGDFQDRDSVGLFALYSSLIDQARPDLQLRGYERAHVAW